jgi:hypothetical protein
MTQYLLSVHGPADAEELAASMTEEDMQAAFKAVDEFNSELQASGAWVFAGGLEPAHTATVVDATGDSVVTTDGPYLESKEIIGGFWVVEAPDLDAALALAQKGSAACKGAVEVRPFQGE